MEGGQKYKNNIYYVKKFVMFTCITTDSYLLLLI